MPPITADLRLLDNPVWADQEVAEVAAHQSMMLPGEGSEKGPQMSPAPESTPASLQRTIADLRRELAERTTQRDEAQAQKTAIAEVLELINSSPGDLASVFEAILERAHTFCGATHGALVIRDGEHFRAVATHGLPEEFAEVLRQPFPTYPGSPHERLLQGEPLIQVPDQAAQELTHPHCHGNWVRAGRRVG